LYNAILLLKQQGNLSAHVQQFLASLAVPLNDVAWLELKNPSDTLRAGYLQSFLAYVTGSFTDSCPIFFEPD